MTNTTPTPGTDTRMTNEALTNYLQDIQGRALRLAGVVTAIAFITNEGRCDEGRIALTYLAEELADDLNNALDSVNHPKEVA